MTDVNNNEPTDNKSTDSKPSEVVPNDLKERDSWICWRIEERDGRETKIPIKPYDERDGTKNITGHDPNDLTPRGSDELDDPEDCPDCPSTADGCIHGTAEDGSERASSTGRYTWRSFSEALEYHTGGSTRTAGCGFVFDPEDFFVGIDLDDCRDPDTEKIDEWAQEVINDLDSYTEISPSGTGLHIFAFGMKPGDRCKTGIDHPSAQDSAEIEIYEESRFFTITGQHISGTPETVENRRSAVSDVYSEHFESTTGATDANPPTDTAELDGESGGAVDLSDEELIEKAKSAKNGEKFSALWEGREWSGLDGNGGQSERDAALCSQLHFWTGNDDTRVDRLFRRSGLMREKWDRDDYRKMTIEGARVLDTYDPGKLDSQDSGGDPLADIEDPAEHAENAVAEAVESVGEDDGVGAHGEAAETAAEGIAEAVEAGLSDIRLDSYKNELVDKLDVGKEPVNNAVEAARESLSTKAEGREPFDQVLGDRLEKVREIRSTDADQKTIFKWWFSPRESEAEHGTFSIETKLTKDGLTHNHWSAFRNEYMAEKPGNEPSPAKPSTPALRGDVERWIDFIDELKHERSVESTLTEGPRKEALDDLLKEVGMATAFYSPEQPLPDSREGVLVDQNPDEGVPTKVMVHNGLPKGIARNHDISDRGLQIQTEDEGLDSPDVTGISDRIRRGTDVSTAWVLDWDALAERHATPLDFAETQDKYEYIERKDRERRFYERMDDEPAINTQRDPDSITVAEIYRSIHKVVSNHVDKERYLPKGDAANLAEDKLDVRHSKEFDSDRMTEAIERMTEENVLEFHPDADGYGIGETDLGEFVERNTGKSQQEFTVEA